MTDPAVPLFPADTERRRNGNRRITPAELELDEPAPPSRRDALAVAAVALTLFALAALGVWKLVELIARAI